jgi:hypothetical protein
MCERTAALRVLPGQRPATGVSAELRVLGGLGRSGWFGERGPGPVGCPAGQPGPHRGPPAGRRYPRPALDGGQAADDRNDRAVAWYPGPPRKLGHPVASRPRHQLPAPDPSHPARRPSPPARRGQRKNGWPRDPTCRPTAGSRPSSAVRLRSTSARIANGLRRPYRPEFRRCQWRRHTWVAWRYAGRAAKRLQSKHSGLLMRDVSSHYEKEFFIRIVPSRDRPLPHPHP